MYNLTQVSEFHLMGFSDDPNVQLVLFGLFLSMYLVTVLGNLLIILAVSSDPHLHTPMYFFLSSLSMADICFTSTTVPKMIVDILTHNRVIFYMGCLTQMSRVHQCVLLLFISVFLSLVESQLHNSILIMFTCFKHMEIANFFCDPSQLLNLSCSDCLLKTMVTYIVAIIFGFFPISGIFLSYYKIVSSILKIPSSTGRFKAFSTCSSHLSTVCLFYGTSIGTYLGSDMSHSPIKGMVASLIYTVVTPMLNPFIYSLRNRDISCTLKRILSWRV